MGGRWVVKREEEGEVEGREGGREGEQERDASEVCGVAGQRRCCCLLCCCSRDAHLKRRCAGCGPSDPCLHSTAPRLLALHEHVLLSILYYYICFQTCGDTFKIYSTQMHRQSGNPSGIIHFIRRSITPYHQTHVANLNQHHTQAYRKLLSCQTPYAVVIRHTLATSDINRDCALDHGPVHALPYGPCLQIRVHSRTCPQRLSFPCIHPAQ